MTGALARLDLEPDIVWFAASGLLLLLTVAAESAVRNVRRNRLARLVDDEAKLARVDAFLERKHEVLDSLLILRVAATSVLVLAAADRATAGAVGARWTAVASGVGVLLVAMLVLAYGASRRVVRAVPERALLGLLPLVLALDFLLGPVRFVISKAGNGIARMFGAGREADDEEEFKDDVLDAAAAGESRGVLEEEEREMIENLIEFADQAVAQVMTPRTRIVSIPSDLPFEDAVKAAHESGHSRIPVHDGTVDKIVGLLFVKDLLKYWGRAHYEQPAVKDIIRQVPFVPETKLISELLREFQSGMVHMAIVLDEYGGTAGLVTVEDLVEEIVGEIHDELDQEEAAAPDAMILKSEREAEVSALVRIDDLNHALNLALPEDAAYDTLGGFLFAKLGRIPSRGDNYEHDRVTFEILEADDRSIRRVKVLVGEPD